MHMIVFTGLVVVEKQQLALDLAQHALEQGQRVAIIDHMAYRRFPEEALPHVAYYRLEGELDDQLLPLLDAIDADRVFLLVSETTPPDVLFAQLDALQANRPIVEVQTLALINTRTCDCFPHLREQLEMYADVVVNMPVQLADVLRQVTLA